MSAFCIFLHICRLENIFHFLHIGIFCISADWRTFCIFCIFVYLHICRLENRTEEQRLREEERGSRDLVTSEEIFRLEYLQKQIQIQTNTELIFRSVNRRRASMAIAKSKKIDTSKTSISDQMKLPKLDFKWIPLGLISNEHNQTKVHKLGQEGNRDGVFWSSWDEILQTPSQSQIMKAKVLFEFIRCFSPFPSFFFLLFPLSYGFSTIVEARARWTIPV